MAEQQKKKFTDEEVKQITEIKDGLQTIATTLGQIRIQRLNLDKGEKETIDKFNELTAKESELAKKLEAKYGRGTLDINTGEFIPSS
tara:strand:- start:191 stop:451 length:261 start_codon:yes stop_codon:yes gene_type:complete